MLVLAEDSSRKTSRPPGHCFGSSFQSFLFSTMSARSCSLARSVFFIAVAQPLERVVDGDQRTVHSQLFVDPLQRGVGMLVHVLRQPIDLLGIEAARLPHLALARAQVAAGLALSLEFMHPPLTNFEALGDLAHRPLVLVISLHHTLPQIQGISSHGPRRYHSSSMCTIL